MRRRRGGGTKHVSRRPRVHGMATLELRLTAHRTAHRTGRRAVVAYGPFRRHVDVRLNGARQRQVLCVVFLLYRFPRSGIQTPPPK
jgi:hypothetical protein